MTNEQLIADTRDDVVALRELAKRDEWSIPAVTRTFATQMEQLADALERAETVVRAAREVAEGQGMHSREGNHCRQCGLTYPCEMRNLVDALREYDAGEGK
jgi:tellurite resistance protein